MDNKIQKPSPEIQKVLAMLKSLGKAIVAVRSDAGSVNLIGTISIGRDGGEPVLSIGGCQCHIHMNWDKLVKIVIEEADVGYGSEGVVRFMDTQGNLIFSAYYPSHTQEKIRKAIERG